MTLTTGCHDADRPCQSDPVPVADGAAAAVACGMRPRSCWRSVSISRRMAPDDYQQGATVKIMFIHVPNAWLSMFVWGVMSLPALGTLVWRHPLADVAAKAAAPIGAASPSWRW